MKCEDCIHSECPVRSMFFIKKPEDIHPKYQEIIKMFSDIDTVKSWGLDIELNSKDIQGVVDTVDVSVRADLKRHSSTTFSAKMRARLAAKRFHFMYKKSHIFFNFIKGKKNKVCLQNFLKTLTVSSPGKGQMHFICGRNFTLCAVSHFFDRLKEREKLDITRPETMDYLYRKLLSKPIRISTEYEGDFIKLNEGVAIGKVFGETHKIIILITYLTDDQLTVSQRYFMKDYEVFEAKLRDLHI